MMSEKIYAKQWIPGSSIDCGSILRADRGVMMGFWLVIRHFQNR